ncbi:hypothetical protein NL676_023858 [Syzygium grande]|nr:hypothetical protein NL676_023858 [Syzygium grande]
MATTVETCAGSPPPAVAKINGRPVLQPNCNRCTTGPTPASLPTTKKVSLSIPTSNHTNSSPLPLPHPISFLTSNRSPRPPLNSCPIDDDPTLRSSSRGTTPTLLNRKKSKSFNGRSNVLVESYSSSLILESPGSIAAVRREQMALQHAQRKMRIAHYGRCKSAKFDARVVPLDSPPPTAMAIMEEDRRCSFITSNSDPWYIAYHDEEWGVPVHDDRVLFELLVLSGAQVGSDWTSILRKRQDFGEAFSGFEAEIVATFTDKHITWISSKYGFDITRVRGVVDNSLRILEIKRQFGSFAKYIWGFVNNKPISTRYKWGYKIPAKTSKSESISKDMVRRGFRSVGPTVVHSFMQAAGLTNDHLITCHRHLQCTALAEQTPT